MFIGFNLLSNAINASANYADFCVDLHYRIESTLVSYLDMLKLKTIEELGVFFSLLELDTGTICSKKMIDVGGWRCADCVLNDNTIFCQDCWSQMKDKHKNHNIVYIGRVSGTCDCGDHNSISKEYFCPKHKGIFRNDYEIQNYIKSSLGEKVPPLITSKSQAMFEDMAIFFVKSIN
jgi:hypothetical protein